jgi:hypothetical protein
MTGTDLSIVGSHIIQRRWIGVACCDVPNLWLQLTKRRCNHESSCGWHQSRHSASAFCVMRCDIQVVPIQNASREINLTDGSQRHSSDCPSCR